MLENIDLSMKIDKKEYAKTIKPLKKRLNELQQIIKNKGIPVIIAFEGWSASGKGTLISRILQPLDPRNFNVCTMAKVNEDMAMRPALWAYWTRTPPKGLLTIFDKSWHRAALPEGVAKWNMGKKAREGFLYDVNAFESQLTMDGTLIIKFFLHIRKEEQRKRFNELLKNPDTSWRVDEDDIKQNKEYKYYLKMYENMLEKTNSVACPWTVVEANDSKYAAIKIYKTLIGAIEDEIERRERGGGKAAPADNFTVLEPTLKKADLTKSIDKDVYKEKLEKLQGRISDLGYKLYKRRRSVVIVYEGWDAAGKGGNIKRVTEELDPRGYEVVPIASPTEEELSHHYHWRFWNKMPKDGHIAIFDRSWYGRVLVERVEGYAKETEWKRAYKEINDMELHMHNHGSIIFKFWLEIDKDEQLNRFKARQEDPLKSYKINDEDWRNREKWDLYEPAVSEMLLKTSTSYAPWTVVESNDKKYARIKTLELIVETLEKELGRAD